MEDEAPYKRLLTAMREQAEQDRELIERQCVAMENLNLYNSFYARQIVELSEMLADFALKEGEAATSEMELDHKYGKGINLYRIINLLNDYDDSNDQEVLLIAVAFIFRELERRSL